MKSCFSTVTWWLLEITGQAIRLALLAPSVHRRGFVAHADCAGQHPALPGPGRGGGGRLEDAGSSADSLPSQLVLLFLARKFKVFIFSVKCG